MGSEQGDIDRKLQVTQAVLNAEKEINNAKLQQANADLQGAKNQAEREQAAQRIYKLTVANAKLEYEATVASAQAEQMKVAAALRHAEALQKQVKTEVALQRSKRIYNDAQNEALKNAAELVRTAEANVAAQEKVNDAVMKGAGATRDARIEAARVALEANRITQNTNNATGAANQLADAYGRAAGNAQAAASAAAGIGGGGGQMFGGVLGGGGSTTKTYKVADYYKMNDKGQIVETTAYERSRQKNQQQLHI